MNNHPYHTILGTLAIRAIHFRTTTVKTNLRILHTNPLCMHRDCLVIWVINSELTIHLEGMCHNAGRILLPQWITLFWVVAHRHGSFPVYIHSLSVPNELSRSRKSKVSNIRSFKNPCLAVFTLIFFSELSFLLGYNDNRIIITPSSLRQSCTLFSI